MIVSSPPPPTPEPTNSIGGRRTSSHALYFVCELVFFFFILLKKTQPFNLCCGEAYARFAELKRQKIHPGKMTKERDAVSYYYYLTNIIIDAMAELCVKKSADSNDVPLYFLFL